MKRKSSELHKNSNSYTEPVDKSVYSACEGFVKAHKMGVSALLVNS